MQVNGFIVADARDVRAGLRYNARSLQKRTGLVRQPRDECSSHARLLKLAGLYERGGLQNAHLRFGIGDFIV